MSKQQVHSRLPSSQAFDHLVYLRIFEGCNLHCLHCFIPANPKRMTIEDISRIPDHLRARVPEGSRVLLQWHGGEPTLLGAGFIEAGIDALAQSGAPYSWQHGIQTNLMNYDASWAELYHRHFGSEVGISWDPEIRLLSKHAPDSHAEFRQRFDLRLSKLIHDGLTPYLVVTAAKSLFKSFPDPFSFFSYWKDRGVNHIHLERITETGFARLNWQKVGLSNAEYSRYMSKWLRAYKLFKRDMENSSFFVSPFEDIEASVQSLSTTQPSGSGCWSGACDTRFHTIDGQGYKAGCTALTSEIGNRNSAHIPKISNSFEKTRELRTFNCGDCEFRRICSSGCLALNFDDGSGECSGGFKFFETAKHLAGGS